MLRNTNSPSLVVESTLNWHTLPLCFGNLTFPHIHVHRNPLSPDSLCSAHYTAGLERTQWNSTTLKRGLSPTPADSPADLDHPPGARRKKKQTRWRGNNSPFFGVKDVVCISLERRRHDETQTAPYSRTETSQRGMTPAPISREENVARPMWVQINPPLQCLYSPSDAEAHGIWAHVECVCVIHGFIMLCWQLIWQMRPVRGVWRAFQLH